MGPLDSKRHDLRLFENRCEGESLDRREGNMTNDFRKRCLKIFTNVEGRRSLGRRRYDNIKLEVKGVGLEGGSWIHGLEDTE
jgi:hypothetical protein